MNRFLLSSFFIALLVSVNCAHAQHWLYSFRPGDTLWDVCFEYTNVPNCWQTIGPENNVVFPRQIPPGTIIKFPIQWLKNVPEPVTITHTRGNVTYQTSTSLQTQPATVGTTLPIGTTVYVGDDSSATLLFANQSVLVLDANSELELNALSSGGEGGMVDSRLRLLRGATTTNVPADDSDIRFQIETPAAVAAVRGTEFRVATLGDNREQMRAEVLEGIVAVANQVDQQDVNQGFGLIAINNVPVPAPVELLPPPIFTTDTTSQVDNLAVAWDALTGAEQYRIELYSDQGTSELLSAQTVEATNYTWPNLTEACYRIALSGIDATTLRGLPSNTRICVIPPLPTVNLHPNDINLVDDSSLVISWLPLAAADVYEVEIATDPLFENLIKTVVTTELQTIYTIENKIPLYARVRAINSEGVRGDPGTIAAWTPTTWDRHLAGFATLLVLIALL